NESYEPVAEEKHFMKHWAYLGLNEVLGVISKWIDKIFLLYLLTASDFAVFFNGAFEIPLFGLLISVAASFMLIEFSGNLLAKDKILDIFKESFNMLSGIVFPLFFFLFFFREEIFSFAFKNKYGASVPIFAISILILPLRINNYSVILQCFSQGKKIMAGSLIDIIIALALMVILYPLMGSRGIVLSIVISTYCQVIYYLWHSAKILRVKVYNLLPVKNLVAKFLILLILYFIISFSINHFSIVLKLGIGTLITLLAVIAGTWSYLTTFFKKNYGKVS
ncbi:MAG: polysaccharide biosynthesis C-terminal domain-containing protein, partial [Bacteroidota bacterium]|nr:polysaccharide biosynthesis C-terminal domain-containing protein [Bacteroidota bacterium]